MERKASARSARGVPPGEMIGGSRALGVESHAHHAANAGIAPEARLGPSEDAVPYGARAESRVPDERNAVDRDTAVALVAADGRRAVVGVTDPGAVDRG